jgi:DNA-binding MarR family transcriptional regulator
MARRPKKDLVEDLIREFRVSCNQDDAFDTLAAECLGVSETDLRCLNIIENAGGLTAGDLAAQSGLTGGAITGVIDRLGRAGFARRVLDPADRRRVRVEVTSAFYTSAERIWGPLAADWHATLTKRFTTRAAASRPRKVQPNGSPARSTSTPSPLRPARRRSLP